MSGFRKKSFPIVIHSAVPVIEVQSQTYEEEHEGNIVSRVTMLEVDLSCTDAAKTLPTYKEYYLEELLKAGVPLDQINVSSYFNKQDAINLDELRANALAKVYSKLDTQSKLSVDIKVEPSKTE